MKLAALVVGASLACAGAANAATVILEGDTIITGNVCTNTCVGFADGDNTPDIYNLFGGGQLAGAFKLIISATDYTLTMNGHTIEFSKTDPHLSISFNNPLLASFAPGSFEFIAAGLYSPAGFAGPETVFDCPTIEPFTPGVPEPTTWALMLIGFAGLGWTRRKSLRLMLGSLLRKILGAVLFSDRYARRRA
jgi:hypothetical protein